MDAQAKQMLQDVGSQLDAGVFPRVKNGGFVMPSELPRPPQSVGLEKKDVERQERPEGKRPAWEPGPRRGEPRWRSRGPWQQWASGARPWAAGDAAPLVGTAGRAAYGQELSALQKIYPGVQLWEQEQGVWVLVESGLFPGLRQHAVFLVGVSYLRAAVRSWAFWGDPLAVPSWIGPRHTNFPDGSICAFEPSDGTWLFGEPLVALLDLYTVWAVRHLHLQTFGRWPGPQAVHMPYERVLELNADEHCGCGESNRRYGECCRGKDLTRKRIKDAVEFFFWSGGVLRSPPAPVERFVHERQGVEALADWLHR